MAKERIGLFGGTFNPVHLGHLRAAWIVQKRFSLNKVLFIPSHIPPHKESTEIASPSHRLKMVELAVCGHPQFIASPIEIEARGKSYSIVTLNKIKNVYPEAWIFFILGMDAFLEIDTWKDYERLLEQCLFIVIQRPGYHLNQAQEVLKGKYKGKIYTVSESERINEELFSLYKIFLLSIEALNISSTEIRRRIKEGKSIKALVTVAVEAYIKENKIYQR